MPFFIPALIAAGVSLAVGIGTTLVANALAPTQTIETGKLDDLSVPKSNYGVVIPQCWGSLKVAGNLLWSTTKREVTRTKKSGGKGGPKTKTKETTYYGSFAVMMAYCPHRPAEKLSRLWLNGKLVYDGEATDPEIISASNEFLNNHVRFYNGAIDQPVDPLIQNAPPIQSYDYGLPHDPSERADALSDLGLDPNLNHIPAYRRKCYIVFENLDLTDYNSQIPAVKASIVFNSGNSLQTIITDICNQSGIPLIEFEGIDTINVPGFYLDSVKSASEIIKVLQQAFFFDVIKSGKTFRFVSERQERPIISIPTTDLGAYTGGSKRPAPYSLPKPDPKSLPESVEITFIDKDGAYETATVIARSQVATSKRKETYSFPVAMTSDRAQAIADSILHRFYLRAIQPKKLSLPPSYCYLEPGDWLEIELNGRSYNLQIASIQMGADRMLKVDTVVVEAADVASLNSTPTPISTGGYNPPIIGSPPVSIPGITNLHLLDINLISDKDEDYGLYVSANGSGDWSEASIYVSNDDNSYYFADVTLSEGTIGALVSTMDSDSTTIEVNMSSGELESISDVDFETGINKLLVGNEIIQFQNAVDNGSNYTLSGLRRGLRGTETYMDAHSIGDRVVLLSGDGAVVERIPGNDNDLGQIRYFKAPSAGQSLDAATAYPVTIEGNALKPYAPVNLAATVDNVGNINLTWDRRDRHAGNYTASQLAAGINNLPLSESEEKWEIEVLNADGSVQRIETTFVNSFNYSAEQQSLDFSGIQNGISVNVYQISAEVGRGYRANATLSDFSFVQLDPVITSIYPNPANYGDLITIKGNHLSSITSVFFGLNPKPATELTIVNNNKITFKLNNIKYINDTEKINFITNGDDFEVIDLIDVFTDTELTITIDKGIGYRGFRTVDSSRSIEFEDFAKILLVDTTLQDITITFDFNNPDYHFVKFLTNIRNMGENKVILVAGEDNELLARSFELINQYDSASFYYQYDFDNNKGLWHGVGAL